MTTNSLRGAARTLRFCALSLLLLAGAASAAVQDYPTRPIRFIVGFPAGGLADLMARSLGQKLTEAWGQQIVIDNRPGAGGIIEIGRASCRERV